MSDVIERLQAGLAHQRAGRRGEAEALYRSVLAEQADEPHALHFLGLLALSGKRADEALDLLARALAVQPDHDRVRLALGRALLQAGRTLEAVALFAAMAEARPGAALPRASLALALLRAGDVAGALLEGHTALELDGSNPEAWFACGTALNLQRRSAEAATALRRAVDCAPDHAEAHLNLGNALFDLDRRAEAEACLRQAVALDPTLAEAHASLGCLLSGDGRLAEAVSACDAAIALWPDFAQAHWNQSFAYMLGGDYAPGWEKYEWRKRHDAFARDFMVLPGPEWQGEPLAGRTLLVRAEQGLGDTIQFARYLKLLGAQGSAVILACDDALRPLLRQIGGVTVVSRSLPLPPYDTWIDQMSLPRLFATRPDTIPLACGFLAAEPARLREWHARLPAGIRVGLVWAGQSRALQ